MTTSQPVSQPKAVVAILATSTRTMANARQSRAPAVHHLEPISGPVILVENGVDRSSLARRRRIDAVVEGMCRSVRKQQYIAGHELDALGRAKKASVIERTSDGSSPKAGSTSRTYFPSRPFFYETNKHI